MIYKIKEIMKKVKGYTDYYVSNMGNVYSTKFNKWRPLKIDYSDGKAKVRLYRKGFKAQPFSVYRLVADAFIGDITDRDVHHENNIKKDCKTSNLSILDKSEHARIHAAKRKARTYAIKHGAMDLKRIKKIFKDLMKG